jgi:hypothetical protein
MTPVPTKAPTKAPIEFTVDHATRVAYNNILTMLHSDALHFDRVMTAFITTFKQNHPEDDIHGSFFTAILNELVKVQIDQMVFDLTDHDWLADCINHTNDKGLVGIQSQVSYDAVDAATCLNTYTAIKAIDYVLNYTLRYDLVPYIDADDAIMADIRALARDLRIIRKLIERMNVRLTPTGSPSDINQMAFVRI